MPATIASCATHQRPRLKTCLGCRQTFCDHCTHYVINSRPWCPECAKQHLPPATSELVKLGKIALTLFALALAFLIVPGFLFKIGAATFVGLGLAKVFWVRATTTISIEEMRNGRPTRSLSHET